MLHVYEANEILVYRIKIADRLSLTDNMLIERDAAMCLPQVPSPTRDDGISLTYVNFTGPGFWGLINPQWSMCNKGRRQSPINIEPDKLLFDPWLRDVQFDKHKVSSIY